MFKSFYSSRVTMNHKDLFDPPVCLSGFFADESSPNDKEDVFQNIVEQKCVILSGIEVVIKERAFDPLNANACWPGNYTFADWISEHIAYFNNRRILELGSATGALAIFMTKLGCDVTTSDYDDEEVTKTIAENFQLNGLKAPLHVPHTWGTKFPSSHGRFDIIIANDILLYVKAFPSLIDSLVQLFTLPGREPASEAVYFYMSWQRRTDNTNEFFRLCNCSNIEYVHLGRRVYQLSLEKSI